MKDHLSKQKHKVHLFLKTSSKNLGIISYKVMKQTNFGANNINAMVTMIANSH